MKRYWPLVVVILISAFAAMTQLPRVPGPASRAFMVEFSGFFFLFLATLKFWDLKGFSHSFSQYDIVAKYSKTYSYIYPFLELIIALAFLAHFLVIVFAIFTLLLMIVSLIGVAIALFKNQQFRCACMGTKLDIPLSVVSLVETLGMGFMSVLIIAMS